jgi:hypothetical protein
MRKNTLKSIFAALAVTSVAVSATAMSSSASFLGDNEPVAYNGAETFKTNIAAVAPEAVDDAKYAAWLEGDSAIKPALTIDTIEVYEDEIDKPVTVNFTMANADKKYSSFSWHVNFDNRLTLTDTTNGAKVGPALPAPGIMFNPSVLSTGSTEEGNASAGQIWAAAMAQAEDGGDGVMFTVEFNLPAEAKAGDVYPIGIDDFFFSQFSNDTFTNLDDNADGQFMERYFFTEDGAITNGAIKVIERPTEPDTEPDTQADTQAETQADTQADTTGAAATTTSGAGSTTTTTAKATNAPPTGVAGVGVAAAGLALAVGTAFVLRKKED